MTTFRPLLAATCDDDNFAQLKFPLLASPKLDGIRCLVRDDILVSRSLKPIRNKALQAFFDWSELNGIDGEIIVGEPTDRECFRRTTSAVMSENGNIQDFTFYVFDNFLARGDFKRRYQDLQMQFADDPYEINALRHTTITNPSELESYEQTQIAKGFEGVMLRSPEGGYKYGRSTFNEGILLKLKRGQLRNGDAEIVGFTERLHNTNEAVIDNLGLQKRNVQKSGMVGRGDLGAFEVRDLSTGFEFKIGTGVGLNDALRTQVWANRESYLSRIIRYEWFQYGGYDKPRFPQFIAFRDKEDIA